MSEHTHDCCDHSSQNHSDCKGGLLHVHGATHGPMLWISLGVTVAFVIGEFVAGRLANSLALVSDAGHNLSDALALGLAAYAIRVAQRPANARKTYGYHRVGILTALFNAVTLILISLLILMQAYHLFQNPEPVNGNVMQWVAAVAVLMNTVIAFLLSGGAKNSLNMRAAYVHMAGDALSAFGVLVAGFLVRRTGWLYIDPMVSVLIALFILSTSWGIVRAAADILLEGTPKDLDTDRMVTAMRGVRHVQAVHDLHTWTVADGMNFLSCHVVVDDSCTLSDCGIVLHDINALLASDFGISHATVQIESVRMCEAIGGSAPLFCDETAVSLRSR